MDGKLENYDLFDKMLGDKYEEGIGIYYINTRLTQLIIYKRLLVKKLKNIRRRRYDTDYRPNDDYISTMGWEYLMRDSKMDPISDFELDRIISSFNDDYYKATIRSIEIKLAFLNKNIKKLKRLAREKRHKNSDVSRVYRFALDIQFKPCNINKSISNLFRHIKFTNNPMPVYMYDGDTLVSCGSVRLFYTKDGECIFSTYLGDKYIKILADNDFKYVANVYNPDIIVDNNEIVITSIKGIILNKKEDKDE